MRSRSFIFWVLFLVDVSPSGYVKTSEEENMQQIEKYSDMNVFVAVGDGVKTLIVMEGDSVTLNTSVTEIKRHDTILWMFGDDEYIAKMNEAAGLYFISEGERFRGRLALDNQTGSLTIKNIRTEHTGHYQLQIRSKSETTKRFSVTVRDAKWKNVIKLNDHTGDLTIRNIQIQHSGDYDLEINNSTTILHMKFNIVVSDLPENSHWNTVAMTVIGIFAVLVILIVLFVIYKKKASWCHKNGKY
ncbi:CD48 antigen [Anabarilius grahami]|uniref:CD48 antigen n=1 Tax=Anabarilius grahami TaxID=495550 RepID=A0A3N0YEI0_ANAGA|nr:CD48 antigen [Anabarilius grahami]